MQKTDVLIDPSAAIAGFDRQAAQYARQAKLQAAVRENLLARLSLLRLQPQWILELGCGSVPVREALFSRYPHTRLVALDYSMGMLSQIASAPWLQRHRFMRVCATAECIPLVSDSVNLVFSNLLLQWSNTPQVVFGEVVRVLKTGGAFLFSTMGTGTLRQLRKCWRQVDEGLHVHQFPDIHQLGSMLTEVGFEEVVLDTEMHKEYYPEPMTLMRSLQVIGASNRMRGRGRGLIGSRGIQRLFAACESLREAAGVPAEFEIVYGLAWKLPQRQSSAEAGTQEYSIPVSQIGHR